MVKQINKNQLKNGAEIVGEDIMDIILSYNNDLFSFKQNQKQMKNINKQYVKCVSKTNEKY
jgi:hypothetical protein